MTIREAISQLDSLCPNACSDTQKLAWLSCLDGLVDREIRQTHEPAPSPFDGYTAETDRETELLVKAPYDEIYRSYMEKEIARANGESARYNAAVTIFNHLYLTYMDYYNRTVPPRAVCQSFRY